MPGKVWCCYAGFPRRDPYAVFVVFELRREMEVCVGSAMKVVVIE
jgi:hypothetical protein